MGLRAGALEEERAIKHEQKKFRQDPRNPQLDLALAGVLGLIPQRLSAAAVPSTSLEHLEIADLLRARDVAQYIAVSLGDELAACFSLDLAQQHVRHLQVPGNHVCPAGVQLGPLPKHGIVTRQHSQGHDQVDPLVDLIQFVEGQQGHRGKGVLAELVFPVRRRSEGEREEQLKDALGLRVQMFPRAQQGVCNQKRNRFQLCSPGHFGSAAFVVHKDQDPAPHALQVCVTKDEGHHFRRKLSDVTLPVKQQRQRTPREAFDALDEILHEKFADLKQAREDVLDDSRVLRPTAGEQGVHRRDQRRHEGHEIVLQVSCHVRQKIHQRLHGHLALHNELVRDRIEDELLVVHHLSYRLAQWEHFAVHVQECFVKAKLSIFLQSIVKEVVPGFRIRVHLLHAPVHIDVHFGQTFFEVEELEPVFAAAACHANSDAILLEGCVCSLDPSAGGRIILRSDDDLTLVLVLLLLVRPLLLPRHGAPPPPHW
mmetsp:Transcript_7059/g.20607  ORF Transcript_7059/g.20607 Transcript_7059/m.20607 type:complete len:483 (-) Transcript_7059:11-1459(-)